ncbi:MAG: hypothetical protein LBC92_05155 [Rickettsiales bacterium]|jgi:ribonucleotide monophosphatase NagD (HAD superfamily)|nr:hypothetical protein [Rickettsiales bacterium]
MSDNKKSLFDSYDKFNSKTGQRRGVEILDNPDGFDVVIDGCKVLYIDKHGLVHTGNGKIPEEVLIKLADLAEKGIYCVFVSNDPGFKDENKNPILDKYGRVAVHFTVTSGDVFKHKVENDTLYSDIKSKSFDENDRSCTPAKVYAFGEVDSNTKNLLKDERKYKIVSDIKDADAVLAGSPRPWHLPSIQKLLDDKRNEMLNNASDENVKNEIRNKTYDKLFKDSVESVNKGKAGPHAIDTLIKNDHALRDYQKIHINYKPEYKKEISSIVDYVGKHDIKVVTINPDVLVPVPDKATGLVVAQTIGSGYFSKQVKKRYPNSKHIICGKPGTEIFKLTGSIYSEKTNKKINENEVAMVGDSIETDAKSVKNNGFKKSIITVDKSFNGNTVERSLAEGVEFASKVADMKKELGGKLSTLSRITAPTKSQTKDEKLKVFEHGKGKFTSVSRDGRVVKRETNGQQKGVLER